MKSDWFHSLSLASTLPHGPCAYISPHLGVPREPCAAFPCASMQEWQTCFPWRWYPSLLKVQLCMTSSLEFALDSPFSGQSFSVVSLSCAIVISASVAFLICSVFSGDTGRGVTIMSTYACMSAPFSLIRFSCLSTARESVSAANMNFPGV